MRDKHGRVHTKTVAATETAKERGIEPPPQDVGQEKEQTERDDEEMEESDADEDDSGVGQLAAASTSTEAAAEAADSHDGGGFDYGELLKVAKKDLERAEKVHEKAVARHKDPVSARSR